MPSGAAWMAGRRSLASMEPLMFDKHRNADGTYNGITMMSEISGLSQAEIRWTWERLRHLMHVDGKSKDEAKAIVREERKSRPWL